MRCALLALLLGLGATDASAQYRSNTEALTLTVASGAPAYAAGEPIEIRVTVANPTDSLAVIDHVPGCVVFFKVDAFDSGNDTPCALVILPLEFPPYSARAYTWSLDPADYAIPTTDGAHTLIGYGWGGADTTSFLAPASTGGRIYFQAVPGVTHESLEPLRDSLGADVLSEGGSVEQGVYASWRVSGVGVDTTAARYQSDPRFISFEVDRGLPPPDVVFTSGEAGPDVPRVRLSASPNPTSARVLVEVWGRTSPRLALDVFDALGRRVATAEVPGGARATVRLDASGWAPGPYTARVRESGETVRFTVVR